MPSSKSSGKPSSSRDKDKKSKIIKKSDKKMAKSKDFSKLKKSSKPKKRKEGHSENIGVSMSDINWDEDVGADTTLLDEFAPTPRSKGQKSENVDKKFPGLVKDGSTSSNETKGSSGSSVKKEASLSPQPAGVDMDYCEGDEVYALDYSTTTWHQGSVIEVDWDESEVLVHFKDGSKSDEWVSMRSQRLSKEAPEELQDPRVTPSPSTPTVLEAEDEPTIKTESEPDKESKPSTSKAPEAPPRPKIDLSPLKRTIRRGTTLSLAKKALNNNLTKKPIRKPIWKTSPPQTKPTPPQSKSSPPQSKSSTPKPSTSKPSSSKPSTSKPKKREPPSLFKTGENVLAKWSDYRLQKFPAVIKNVLGGGKYDVLFYDGFEKTLTDEDLFKTTDEEISLYQKSNPSQADLYVNFDVASKEERRAKKRKTYDEYYVVESDYKKKKSVDPTADKTIKATDSPAHSPADSTAGPPRKKVKRKTLDSEPKEEEPEGPGEGGDPEVKPEEPSTAKGETQEPTQEAPPVKEESKETSEAPEPPKDTGEASKDVNEEPTPTTSELPPPEIMETTPPPPVKRSKPVIDIARFDAPIPDYAHPLYMVGLDGVTRKSVIIGDSGLTGGWSKHATFISEEDGWDVFLQAPDGYTIHTIDGLRSYFKLRGQSRPHNVDFYYVPTRLPDDQEAQKHMEAKENTNIRWEKRRKSKGRPSSKSFKTPRPEGEGSPQNPGRVRTLLPKVPKPRPFPDLAAQDISTPISDSDIWRCPKEGCDKKFRKENLLQMHVKHYHSELKDFVSTAPKVLDLAYARNSDWTQETAKTPSLPSKKSSSKGHGKESTEKDNSLELSDSGSRTPYRGFQDPMSPFDDIPGQSRRQSAEKKSTIKTILPLRPADTPKCHLSVKLEQESDDFETDEEFNEGFKISHKPIKNRANKKPRLSATLMDDGLMDPSYSLSSNVEMKKKQNPAIDKLQIATDSNDSFTEEEKPSPNAELIPEDALSLERLMTEEVINCSCGFKEEDGLMIQCEICLCWQHGLCNAIAKDSDVPDQYVCYVCRNPPKVRSSQKYSYASYYLPQGKLPTLTFRTCNKMALKQRENMLKKSFELSGSIRQIVNVERSIRTKINICQQADHPKLYLWAKAWDDPYKKSPSTSDSQDSKKLINGVKIEPEISTAPTGPEPEAPIDLVECRLKLLDHIENYQQQLEDRLTSLQTQVAALESIDPDLLSEESEPRTHQIINLLMRDLSTLQKLAVIGARKWDTPRRGRRPRNFYFDSQY